MTAQRRDFLKLLGLAGAAPILDFRGVRSHDPDLYRSRALGLEVRKPSTWRFVSAVEVQIKRESLKVIGGDRAKQELLEMSGTPLVAATRAAYPEVYPGFVTWVQLAHANDDAADDVVTIAAVHTDTYRRYGDFFPSFRFLKRAAPSPFLGRPATRCVVTFRDPEDGVQLRLQSHLLRWHSVWLTFNFLDPTGASDPQTAADFLHISESLQLLPPGQAA
jgi:hypothetical protein